MLTTDEVVPVILVMNEEFWLPYCLESVRGRFSRYVIYDIGSKDSTRDVLRWFLDASPNGTSFVYRELPFVEPKVQGVFRNSMIAEAMSDWYLILDGDEVYTQDGLDNMILEMENMKEMFISKHRTYGVVRRVETTRHLTHAYGQNLDRPHHRIYHRKMIFGGPHPGEYPLLEQKSGNEHWFSKKVVCYHFHNCSRSRLDEEVPSRIRRRTKDTYHRGEALPFDLFEKIPILKNPIESFPVCPKLAELQQQ